MNKRRSIYFMISVALAALGVIPFYFLREYYADRYINFRELDLNDYLANILANPYTLHYFVLFSAVIVFLGVMKIWKMRIVWLAFLGEFLYIFYNIFIYNRAGVIIPARVDPLNVAGFTLLVCSAAFAVVSLGIKDIQYRDITPVVARTTTGFLLFCVVLLVGVMTPLGIITMFKLPASIWSFPLAGDPTIPVSQCMLVLIGKALPPVLLAVALIALVANYKRGYLYITIVLFFFGLRWIEMIGPVVVTSHYVGFTPFVSPGLMYEFINFVTRTWPLFIILEIIPLVSFILGFVFLSHIVKDDTPDAS